MGSVTLTNTSSQKVTHCVTNTFMWYGYVPINCDFRKIITNVIITVKRNLCTHVQPYLNI